MKIGFDVSQTGTRKTGTGFHAYSLIDALLRMDYENEYILYPTFGEYYWDPDWEKSIKVLPSIKDHLGLSHQLPVNMRNFWRNPPPDMENQLGDPDILHANNFYCPDHLRKAKLVYTLYDLGFIVEPAWTTETNRVICFDGVFSSSIFADGIIAISDSSRTAFMKFFPHYPPDRLKTIYPGCRFTSQSPVKRPGLPPSIEPGKYWLAVGTLEPRKNYRNLVQAYDLYRMNAEEPLPLVLIGSQGWLMDDFTVEFSSPGLLENIHLTGYVDDAELLWWYQNCYAFLYPSLYEGFGMPILEAMSQSAAVITSTTTSMPEVAGEAAILVDPENVAEITSAMVRLSNGEVNLTRLREEAARRAASFTWENTAKQTLDFYKEVAVRPYLRSERG